MRLASIIVSLSFSGKQKPNQSKLEPRKPRLTQIVISLDIFQTGTNFFHPYPMVVYYSCQSNNLIRNCTDGK